jgi:hypothetical protein
MTEDHDELQDLLDQLDDDIIDQLDDQDVEQIDDEISRITEDEAEVIESESTTDDEESEEPDEVSDSTPDKVPDSTECALQPLDTRQIEEITEVSTEIQETPAIDVVKYHDRLDTVTTEVLTACRSDRQEAQDVIDLLRLQIDDAVNKSQSPQRMWVDGLVKAVEVKAGINATAVKIIEANAKMLAATKAGVNILNQNVNTGSQDLEELLSRPLTDLDEY